MKRAIAGRRLALEPDEIRGQHLEGLVELAQLVCETVQQVMDLLEVGRNAIDRSGQLFRVCRHRGG